MSKILVTGGNGFIGSALMRRLIDTEHDAVGIDLETDITNKTTVDALFQQIKPCLVYHLAGITTTQTANENPQLCHSVNVVGTINILEAAKAVGARVLVASSDQVYRCEYVKASDHYSTSKAAADLIAQVYGAIVVRQCNVYGPGDKNMTRIVPATISKVLRGEAPVIYGSTCRHMLFIDDLLDFYARVIAPGVYNIIGPLVSMAEIAQTIIELIGCTVLPQFLPAKKEEPTDKGQSFKSFVYGQTSLPTGLQKTIEWYKNNPN